MKTILASITILFSAGLTSQSFAQTGSIFEVAPSKVKTSYDVGVASVFRNQYVGSDIIKVATFLILRLGQVSML